jgi:hypothetical protein
MPKKNGRASAAAAAAAQQLALLDSDEESPKFSISEKSPERPTEVLQERSPERPSELVAAREEFKNLRSQLDGLGLSIDESAGVVSETPLAQEQRQKEQQETKDLRKDLERISADLSIAEDAKRAIVPSFERAKKNAELKERGDALKREISEEESCLRSLDTRIRVLDAELSAVTTLYKKKRDQRAAFTASFGQMVGSLLSGVAHKIRLTAPVDDESSRDYVEPGDCIEVSGQLASTRERAHLVVDKHLRELQCACEFKEKECDDLRCDNGATLRRLRESRDESIRALVFAIQDERNRLLADIEELITTTSDQSVNLRVGHVHVNAQDRSVFKPLPERRTGSSSRATRQPQAAVGANALTARKSVFKNPNAPSDELRFLAEKNKEMLSELAQMKADICKVSAERTEAIQVSKKLQNQLKRDREHYEAALQKLDSQIIAEQSAARAVEKDNSKITDVIEQLSAVLKASRKHLEYSRTKTVPLPIE